MPLLSRSVAAAGDALRELAVAHCDVTLLLMAPTNVAFGLCTAFFPYTVTILAKDALGAAAVGWLYAAANVVSALAAAAFGLVAQRWPGCRPAIFAAGAGAFAGAAGAVFGAGAAAPSRAALFALFCAYGVGVAVWQGTCMAFFGDAFPGRKALPAFAALKLHSGLSSAIAFFVLPAAPPRAAAAACVAAALLGFATYLGAEARVRWGDDAALVIECPS
jgi:MFS family permease